MYLPSIILNFNVGFAIATSVLVGVSTQSEPVYKRGAVLNFKGKGAGSDGKGVRSQVRSIYIKGLSA